MTRKMTGVGAQGALSFTALHAACHLGTQRLSDGNEVDAMLVRGLTGASIGSGKVSQSHTAPTPHVRLCRAKLLPHLTPFYESHPLCRSRVGWRFLSFFRH